MKEIAEQQEDSNEYGFFYGRPTIDSTALGYRHSDMAQVIKLYCSFLSDTVRRIGAFTTGTGLD